MRSVAALLLALGLPVASAEQLFNTQVIPSKCVNLGGHTSCLEGTQKCVYNDPNTGREAMIDLGRRCSTDSRKTQITRRSPVPPPEIYREIEDDETNARPMAHGSGLRWAKRAPQTEPVADSAATTIPDVAGGSVPAVADDAATTIPDVAGGSAPAASADGATTIPDVAGGSAPAAAAGAASIVPDVAGDSPPAGSDTNTNLFTTDAGPADTNPAIPGLDASSKPGAAAVPTGLGPSDGSDTETMKLTNPLDSKPEKSDTPDGKKGLGSANSGSANTDTGSSIDIGDLLAGKVEESNKPKKSGSIPKSKSSIPKKFARRPKRKSQFRRKLWITKLECRAIKGEETCLSGRRVCRYKDGRTGKPDFFRRSGSCHASGGFGMNGEMGASRHHSHGSKSSSEGTTIVINTGGNNKNVQGQHGKAPRPRLRGVHGPTAGAMDSSWERMRMRMRRLRKIKAIAGFRGGKRSRTGGHKGAGKAPLTSPWIYKSPENAECNKLGGTTGCSGGKVTCIYRNDNGKFHIRRLSTTCSWRIVNPAWRSKEPVS